MFGLAQFYWSSKCKRCGLTQWRCKEWPWAYYDPEPPL